MPNRTGRKALHSREDGMAARGVEDTRLKIHEESSGNFVALADPHAPVIRVRTTSLWPRDELE